MLKAKSGRHESTSPNSIVVENVLNIARAKASRYNKDGYDVNINGK